MVKFLCDLHFHTAQALRSSAQPRRVCSCTAWAPDSCCRGNLMWNLMRRLPLCPGALLMGMPSPCTVRSEPGVATCTFTSHLLTASLPSCLQL